MAGSTVTRSVIGFGAGGNAKVVIEILRHQPDLAIKGLLDRNSDLWGKKVLGVPILGNDALVAELVIQGATSFFIGVGAVATLAPRRTLYETALLHGLEPVNAVHPSAILSPSASFGAGFTAMAGSIVNADSVMGENVILNTGAIVEHDCIMGNHVHVAPGAIVLGGVRIGDGTMIGAGAVIRQGIAVGAGATVGAGAVVVKDVLAGQTVVGNPARPLTPPEQR